MDLYNQRFFKFLIFSIIHHDSVPNNLTEMNSELLSNLLQLIVLCNAYRVLFGLFRHIYYWSRCQIVITSLPLFTFGLIQIRNQITTLIAVFAQISTRFIMLIAYKQS